MHINEGTKFFFLSKDRANQFVSEIKKVGYKTSDANEYGHRFEVEVENVNAISNKIWSIYGKLTKNDKFTPFNKLQIAENEYIPEIKGSMKLKKFDEFVNESAKSPKEMGEIAKKKGIKKEFNPYKDGSDESKEWESGWNSAKEDKE